MKVEREKNDFFIPRKLRPIGLSPVVLLFYLLSAHLCAGDEESWLDPVADPEKYGRSSFAGQASFDDGAAALRRQGLGKLVLSNNAVSDREV